MIVGHDCYYSWREQQH
ncbi:MAG: hypothetical protein ACLSH6_08635 [Limosilactobacillus pontis]